jgi:hypothetical protein
MGAVSVVIMAHPWREGWARALAREMDAPVVWDEGRGIWDTGRRALLRGLEMGADHHLVLQDDVILSPGLGDLLPQLARPGVVCLYMGNNTYARRAMGLARHYGVSWFRYGEVVYGPAVMMPADHIAPAVEHGDGNPIRSYDTRLRDYYRAVKVLPYYTAPSLVDHRVGNNPSIKGNRDNRHATWFGSGEGVDWSGEALEFDHKALQPVIEMTDGVRSIRTAYRSAEYHRLLRTAGWRVTPASRIYLRDPAPRTVPALGPGGGNLGRQTLRARVGGVTSARAAESILGGAMAEEMVAIKMRMHLPEARIGEVVQMEAGRAARLVEKNWATYVEDQAYISEGPRPAGASARVDVGASGYAWRDEPGSVAEADEYVDPDRPSGNGSREEWETYRLSRGYSAEELQGKGRNELRDLEDR